MRGVFLTAFNQQQFEGRIIPIAWHSSLSGKDKLNEENATMHNARIDYYGMPTPPAIQINGTTQAGISQLPTTVNAVPETSPILIDIEQRQTDDSIAAKVEISSTESVPSATLYIAVIEGYHYEQGVGTTEREFYNTARQMLPSNAGTPISIAAGQSLTIEPEAISLPPHWERKYMYIVAWLQNDETKEVLQAASTRGRLIPQAPEQRSGAIGTNAATAQWQIRADPNLAGTCRIDITKDLPAGWSAAVTVDGEAIEDTTGEFAVSLETATAITVAITPSFAEDKNRGGSVSIRITGPRDLQFARTFRLYGDDLDLRLRFLDPFAETNGLKGAYTGILRLADRYSYAVIHREDQDLFPLRDGVTLIAGGKGAFTATEIERLRAGFDAGGVRIFLTGAEIGFALADIANTDSPYPRNEAFMRDYLHALYVRDANPAENVVGIPNDPVSDGMNTSIKFGLDNQNAPDEITPLGEAVPVFYYGSGNTEVAGLRYADNRNRLIYLSFGAEGIGPYVTREELLTKGIEWLLASDVTTGLEEEKIDVKEPLVLNTYPVPATESVNLSVTLRDPSRITVRLYNVLGDQVIPAVVRDCEAGPQRVQLNVADLPAGIYTLLVEGEGHTEWRTVNVVR